MIRRFGLLIFAIGAAGLAVALWADPKSNNEDAWREVSGAVVSGAVLAGLVVWFEDRREVDRVERAEERDDEAARRAWRREIDIRLVALVRTDLSEARRSWRRMLDRDTKERERGALDLVATAPGPSLEDTMAEVEALLNFLRESSLQQGWQDWRRACKKHEFAVPAPEPAQTAQLNPRVEDDSAADRAGPFNFMAGQDFSRIAESFTERATRDMKQHLLAAAAEDQVVAPIH